MKGERGSQLMYTIYTTQCYVGCMPHAITPGVCACFCVQWWASMHSILMLNLPLSSSIHHSLCSFRSSKLVIDGVCEAVVWIYLVFHLYISSGN